MGRLRFLQEKQRAKAVSVNPTHQLVDLAKGTGRCREYNRFLVKIKSNKKMNIYFLKKPIHGGHALEGC
jgi:hypothetical protein